jgi:acyl-CoA synthetase (NDP forming)
LAELDFRELDRIFRARSVALIGVSSNPHKLNGAPLGILRATEFAGTIYPVNPKYDSIAGLKCYAKVEDLPVAPDVAVVFTPASDVPPVIDACGRKGIRAAVVISSGFEEEHSQQERVSALREACVRHGIVMIGPNCEGVWSVRSRVLLTFGSAAKREHLAHRPIAILSQSGSISGALARHLQDSGFGCAYVVSVGNETIVDVLDCLEYMLEQDDVALVLLFLEGLHDGERLLRIADAARRRGIPIVALKSGNSARGSAAAASHTGKLATPYAIYRDVLAQAGVIQVGDLSELIEAAEVLTTLPPPRSVRGANPGLAVFSIPGGTGSLTADECEIRGVPLAVFEEKTTAQIARNLPAFGSAVNPTDLTGQVLSAPEIFNDSLGYVAGDPNTEALLIQFANRGPRDLHERCAIIAGIARKERLPVVAGFLGDQVAPQERRSYADDEIVCARDPAQAVRYFDWIYRRREILARPPRVFAAQPSARRPAPHGFAAAAALLAEAGVAVPPWTLLSPGDDVALLAQKLRFPIAVKALPEQADHKTELGLLRLNVDSPQMAHQVAAELRARLGDETAPLLAQEMVSAGVEVVLSFMRDPDFGAMLALGVGGVLVELAADVGYLCLPADEWELRKLIERLRIGRLLAGYRGASASDVGALVAATLRLSEVFLDLDAAELEINPLIVRPRGQGVVALDLLLRATPKPN